MESFIDSHYRGEDSVELNQLMENLLQADPSDQTNVNQLLDRIADIRGVNRGDFRDQYQTYLNLSQNAGPNGGINLSKHGDFLGSTASMRYGAVVGDVFGIDPVFGSLLNPTGGLVGPGNLSYEPGDNDAVGYHGIFHDAAGYLYNFHDRLGPGYDYLNREPFPTTFPGTGQIGGISWWASHSSLDVNFFPEIMPDIPYVPRFIERGIGNAIEDGTISNIREVIYLVEGGTDINDGINDVFHGNFSEGAGDIMDGVGTIMGGASRSIVERIIGSSGYEGVRDLSRFLFGSP